MADIIQAQIIDEEIVTPSADPVAHNMPGGGAVESVNGRTGAVVLTADDVGAVAAETFNTAIQGKQDKLTAGAGAEIKDGVLSATSLGITGAAVGQIARITAVDSDGKPTAWEPVDIPSGTDGKDGYSPTATVTQTDSGATISITDKNGTTTATVTNGKDGSDGANGSDGQNGISPVVSVSAIAGGHRITIVDVNETKTVDVMDGSDGQNGSDGNGITSAVLNADYTLTLTFDDGTTYITPNIRGATGATGNDGKDGTSVFVSSISESTEDSGSNVITFSDGKTITIKNGSKGSTGPVGASGADGTDGHTPVKGTDYWTETDKSEIIAEVTDALYGIPNYWTSALETGVQEINTALCNAGRNKSAFLFYSDAHWSNEMTYTSKMAPKLLKYLYKHTPINQTNFGGDIVSAEGTDNETMSYLWDWREQVRDLPNHHSVIGNHDDGNTTDRLFTKEYIYAYLLAPEETNDIVSGGDFYYYIDNLCEKTRYLYLDTMYDGVSDTQLAWASEAIKGVSDGWHIVAISHAWYANDYSVYPPILNGFDTNAKKFLDMFDNYNARSGEYGECLGFVDLCIGGHYHLDHYENTDGGIPVIIVEADTFHDRSGTMPTHGNTTESAVSAVVVDRSNKVVKVIRIGRGSSFEVPINVSTVTYTNVISISVGSDGQPFNNGIGWCANSRIGSGGIYMGNQSGDAAQWVTGHIAIDPTISNTFRLKNITFNKESTNSNHGIAFFDSSFARVTMDGTFNWKSPAGFGVYSPVYDSDGNITEFTFTTDNITNTNVAYIAICAGYIGDDSIITINEPIE